MRTLTMMAALAFPAVAGAVEVELTPNADVRSLTQSLSPGAIYTFNDGVYELPDEWSISGEGSSSDPIIFRAARGARPVIRLTTSGSRALRIHSSAHLVIQGLIFEHDDERYAETNGNGIRVENSEHIRIDDCEIRHTGGTGISLGSDNSAVQVTQTEIHNTRDGHGIYAGCGNASCWVQDSLFANNLIYDIKGRDEEIRVDGIHIAPGGQGNQIVDNILVEVNRHGIVAHSTEFGSQNLIEGNAIWDTGQDGLWVSGAARVRNNLVAFTGRHGLYSENNRESLEQLVVSHNSFVATGSAAVRLRQWQGLSGMVFANNALVNPVGDAFQVDNESLDEGIVFSGNVITGSVSGVTLESGGFVPGGGYTDFVDIDALDFYPRASSALRDAADPSGAAFVPSIDFNGFDRNGDRPTVGALEYVFQTNPGWPLSRDFKAFEDRRIDDDSSGGCCGDNGSADSAIMVPLLLLGGLIRRRRRSGAHR